MGHHQGLKTLKGLFQFCKNWTIKILTAYDFSDKNTLQPTEEVNFLMLLFEKLLGTT